MEVIRHGIIICAFLTFAPLANCQQSAVRLSRAGLGDQFFEQVGVNPPFVRSNRGAQVGFGLVGGGINVRFNLLADQSSNQFFATTSPSIMLSNAVPGQFFSGVQIPFITSITPISSSPVRQAINRLNSGELPERSSIALDSRQNNRHVDQSRDFSSAAKGDVSVAEIRRRQRYVDHARLLKVRAEIAELTDRAQRAERNGRHRLAGIYRRMVRQLQVEQ